MLDFLYTLAPNLELLGEELWKCTIETLQMVFVSGIISFIFGIIFGVILIVTRPGGILRNKVIYNILDKLINVIRSVPFLILMVLLIPVSRAIVGTGSGVQGAYVALIAGTVPFFSRQIETAISEVDTGLIEASQAMGATPFEIITRVYLRESIPSIARVTMITVINLIGLTAMAGAIGAGGLGDFAIRYGYQMNYTDMIWCTILIILVLISVIQLIGNLIIKKTSH
ncbi:MULTISPECIES: methionine ABC transporter permease [Bacillota]|jgi:D-methionine transport system permease protein|uniref:ABC transporter permease n=2 Tax=Amedibacillus TaxID=2749846 RepID=A0A7G9GL55_9FIRM|nr:MULTISPECIES: methionine ABC transporter permease [Bacillota]QNM11537.1 ABC transporter permease [[Eubacterium] hominis]MCH4285221.1 ABC transporter permease [Amedibacillus hominis]RGB56244.1 ABC transporter permease [Absiella sp. AM22-9]RGB62007.1 ABC transporter permease [Absiella sp. AM10-20]RGB70171.1 ABC transporter permease [Absiella sp. AM09-45]